MSLEVALSRLSEDVAWLGCEGVVAGCSAGGGGGAVVGQCKLRVLVRGDFLCEALEHLEATGEDKQRPIRLKLEEFWASEVCYSPPFA